MSTKLRVNYEYFFDQQHEVGITVLEKQNSFQEHTHNYFEIICQMNGDIDHIVNGIKYHVNKNQLLLVGIGDIHQNLESDSTSIIFLISEKYMNNIVIESAFDPSVTKLKQFLISSSPIVLDINQDMQKILNTIYLNYTNSCSAYYIKQRLLITQFILGLEDTCVVHFPLVQTDQTDLITYIFNNLKSASLHDYSDLVHYSPVTVGAKIKEKYGKTFSQILKQIRFKKAADYLADTDYSIEKIMELVGYTNKTYFYTNFKGVYNLSPAKYRDQINKIKGIH